jgi:hypothetical protein
MSILGKGLLTKVSITTILKVVMLFFVVAAALVFNSNISSEPLPISAIRVSVFDNITPHNAPPDYLLEVVVTSGCGLGYSVGNATLSDYDNVACIGGYYGADFFPPGKVTDFTASLDVTQDGKVRLTWTAPCNDFTTPARIDVWAHLGISENTTAQFRIQYSSFVIDDSIWNPWVVGVSSRTTIVISTYSVTAGSPCVHVTSLTLFVTYYFRLWTFDEECNVSPKSNLTSLYVRPIRPSAVTDLRASTGFYGRTIDLAWTAPGDNFGELPLPAGSTYYIQYTSVTAEATDPSWWDMSPTKPHIIISTGPVAQGTPQYFTVTGLLEGVTYYFRLWTSDNYGAWSDISNGATAWAQYVLLSVDLVEPNTYYDFGTLTVNVSSVSTIAIWVRNNGNVKETYKLKGSNSVPSSWVLAVTNDVNQFVLWAAFHSSTTQPGSNDFGDEDKLSTTAYECTITTFSINGTYTGVGVVPEHYSVEQSTRYLWLKILTPKAIASEDKQRIDVSIIATDAGWP